MDAQEKGSPLRMRGKVIILYLREVRYRITPAYAGKSFVSQFLLLIFWDHPCVCGEKQTSRRRPKWPEGSPLRMRGKGNGQGR